jgi:hypothetical protein
VVIEGTDAEGDVERFRLTMLDAEGNDLFPGDPFALIAFADVELRPASAFTGSGVYGLPELPGLEAVASVRISVVDRAGLESEGRAYAISDPTPIDIGGACDPADFTSACAGDALCEAAVCVDVPRACPADWGVIDLNAHPGPMGGCGSTKATTPTRPGAARALAAAAGSTTCSRSPRPSRAGLRARSGPTNTTTSA